MNKIEVFDKIYNGLKTQGRPSFIIDRNEVSCRYRTDSGDRCAVGMLIADEDYDPKIEGRDVYNLPHEKIGIEFDHLAMLTRLQELHDDWARVGGEFPESSFQNIRQKIINCDL